MDIHSISIATPGIRKRKKILVSILWMRHSGFFHLVQGMSVKEYFYFILEILPVISRRKSRMSVIPTISQPVGEN
jgi:hypothetical protein